MKYRRQTMELLERRPPKSVWMRCGGSNGAFRTRMFSGIFCPVCGGPRSSSGGGAALGDDAGEAIAAAVRKIAAGDYAGRFRRWSLWAGDPRALPLP